MAEEEYEVLKFEKMRKKKGTIKITSRIVQLERRPQGPYVAYYDVGEDGEKGVERGSLPLIGAKVEAPPGGSPSPRFTITINQLGHKNDHCPISFTSESAEGAKEWLAAIQEEIDRVRNHAGRSVPLRARNHRRVVV
jgi:hypothetical protein